MAHGLFLQREVKFGVPFPRLAAMMDPKDMPFDVKRMCYGGFDVLVDA